MPDYRKLKKARKAMYTSLSVALVAVAGIFGVFFFTNSNNNAQLSQASTPEGLTEATVVTAVNTSGNDELIGLNSRADTCSTEIVGVVEWGETGELLETEGKIDSCVGRTLTWYHIRWESGIEGWSIIDFLEFSDSNGEVVEEE
jgi:hypothetical protein